MVILITEEQREYMMKRDQSGLFLWFNRTMDHPGYPEGIVATYGELIFVIKKQIINRPEGNSSELWNT